MTAAPPTIRAIPWATKAPYTTKSGGRSGSRVAAARPSSWAGAVQPPGKAADSRSAQQRLYPSLPKCPVALVA
eukprot:COSAG06_NODE_831_length_12041_cov_5.766789_9_plen_73_part_00